MKRMCFLLALMPCWALAEAAGEEPSMLAAAVPFVVFGLLLVLLGPLVAKKKK